MCFPDAARRARSRRASTLAFALRARCTPGAAPAHGASNSSRKTSEKKCKLTIFGSAALRAACTVSAICKLQLTLHRRRTGQSQKRGVSRSFVSMCVVGSSSWSSGREEPDGRHVAGMVRAGVGRPRAALVDGHPRDIPLYSTSASLNPTRRRRVSSCQTPGAGYDSRAMTTAPAARWFVFFR
jgi:hypothetical protein